MCVPESRRLRARQAGVSLVELMVGMVISMLVALAALASAQFFMASQRQATGVGSATANAVSAIAAMKFEAAQAGLGFYNRGLMPCTALNLSVGNEAHSDGAPFFPVSVTSSGNAATLTLAYGSALEAAVPAPLRSDSASDAAEAEVVSYVPAAPGQAVMLAPSPGVSAPCTVKTVSETAPADAKLDLGQRLLFKAGGTHNDVAFATATRYPAGSQLYLLGELRKSRFRLRGSDLVMERPLESAQAVVIAKDVVAFAVQYGVTDGVTPALSEWVYPEGTWAALDSVAASRIKALRIGLVTRADQREKPGPSGACAATTEQPVLLDRALALTGDWQCFRYRALSVVVPLRNMLMGFPA